MTETAGRVLVVDRDYDTLDALATALRGRGLHVVLATDGRSGLSHAVEVAVEVVLVERDVDIVDLRTFIDVLRDNARTSSAHLFVMAADEPARLAAADSRAEPIVKPFNADEVAARVEEILRRRRGPRVDPELKGDLAQVAVFDLLQVFRANRRTGRLSVDGTSGRGELWVDEGTIVDAAFGPTTGEKALFRVLAQREGRFVFLPDVSAPRRSIEGHMDHLLMEAVRHVDEIALLADMLPGRGALLRRLGVPADPRGLEGQILLQLAEPRSPEELCDLLPEHDLEVLRAVADLLDMGIVEVLDEGGQRVDVCDPDELPALRSQAVRLRRGGLEGPARLGVVAEKAADLTRLLRALSAVRQFAPSPEGPTMAGDGMFGPVGALRLGGFDVELFALPLDPSLRPLWGAVLAASTAALVVSRGEPPADVERLAGDLDVRLVPMGPGWERPAGVVEALRRALDPRAR